MATLNIRLLGRPEITVDQQPLSFRTRKVFALLVYLVIEEGMHSRESLMTLLWPEFPAQKAAVTLRVTLTRLRKALQPAGEILITVGGQVGFDSSCPVDLDLAWLSSAVLPEAPLGDLEAILDIDRGEFLTGFSLPDAPEFDNWAAIQREACQRQVEMIYDRLTQNQLANHDIAPAIEAAARWVARSPLSEAAYRRLMAAQALNRDRSAALKTYAECREMLQEEFGIEPARETAVLAESIGNDRLAGRLGDAIAAPGSALARTRTSSRQGSPLPFAGRAEEHNQLVTAFRRASQGGVQVIALIGVAGVGKTRLLNTFREWAILDSPGVEIWEGRAFEMGGHLPYQPVIEALRLRLERENAPEDLLDDIWLAELSQLVPDLRARYPDLPPPMTGDASFVRARLFAAIAELGSALVQRNPAILILDDMQWADGDTRDLVHYLASRWAESNMPILLLLAIRQENYAADTPLREWLAQVGRDTPLRRLLVDSLSGTAVRQLVTRLADPQANEEVTDEFGAWLWAETHGLPFFIEALLQMLVEQGNLAVAESEGYPRYDFTSALAQVRSAGRVQVPPGVREAILARLDRFSEDKTDLLLAAAVLGRECSFETLCQVTDMSEASALEAVETLLNSNLLVERSPARRPYTLAHDYIREVVYSESREVRRRIFHRRALLALEAEHATAAECAYHAAASLLDEPAFRYSLAAGDEALQSNAFSESLVHYDRAREIAQRMGNGTANLESHALKQLYQNRGRALELTLQYEAAQANYQELEHLAAERDDSALRLAAIVAQGIIHATYNPVFDPQKARELSNAALKLAVEVKDREAEASALWCLMMVEFHTRGDSQQMLAYGEKALAIARELGLKELEGFVLGNLSWAYSLLMRLDEARQANRQALDIWQALGNLPMATDATSIKMGNLRLAGEYKELLATGKEAVRLSQVIGNALHHYMALLSMSEVHYMQGRLEQALILLEKAAAVGAESGDDRLLWGHLLYQIPVYLIAGDLEQAAQIADQLYAFRQDTNLIFQNILLAIVASAKVALGKLQEGEAILSLAFSTFDQGAPFSFGNVPLFMVDGRLQLALGNPAGTLERTEDVISLLIQAGSRYYLVELLWLQGQAWLALEKTEQAKKALKQARAVAEDTGERTILWQILVTLSDLENMRGNQQEAERLKCQAREIIHYIAENAGSHGLRDSFLAQPAVRQILSNNE